MKRNLTSQVQAELRQTTPAKGKLHAIAKRHNAIADTPSSDDPKEELRRLVTEHRNFTRRACAMNAMSSDRKNRTTGEKIPCPLRKDAIDDIQGVVKRLRHAAEQLKPAMIRQLRHFPLYTLFLKKAYGIGPIVSAYLIIEVDIHKAVKPSNLRRYCGLAVCNGRLERPTRGQKLAYNANMRTRLYQAFSSMTRNGHEKEAVSKKSGKPQKPSPQKTSKYLKIWDDYKNRMQHSERYDKKNNTLLEADGVARNGKKDEPKTALRNGAAGVINTTGWHKAADVFLEDYYTIARTLEGLEVWPSYYAAKLGVTHRGGTICNGEPRLLTVEQALALIGDVGGHAIDAPAEHYAEQSAAE